jgi:DNA-binding transcriptional regulator YdaS (Cro superfamily)
MLAKTITIVIMRVSINLSIAALGKSRGLGTPRTCMTYRQIRDRIDIPVQIAPESIFAVNRAKKGTIASHGVLLEINPPETKQETITFNQIARMIRFAASSTFPGRNLSIKPQAITMKTIPKLIRVRI